MQELTALVEKLSGSELPLEESIALYEQGVTLHAQLEAQLAQQTPGREEKRRMTEAA